MGELAPLLPALLPALNWPLVLVLGAGAAVALLGCLDRRQRALDLTGSGKRIARQQSSEMWYQRHMRRRAAQRKADKGRKGRRGGRRKPLRYSDRETLEKALSHPLRIVIDCSYASVHTLQERRSLATQLVNAWAYHRRCEQQVSMWIAGTEWDGDWWPDGIRSWTINKHDGDAADLVAPGRTVYLSPDGDEELEKVEEGTTYVIGGLVDRSLAKGLSKTRADKLGVESRYLPLERAVGKLSNPALNVDAVFRILHRAYTGGDVVGAVRAELPKRRRGQQKGACTQQSEVTLPHSRDELDQWRGHDLLAAGPKTRLLNTVRRLAQRSSQPEPAPAFTCVSLHAASVEAEAEGRELTREEALGGEHGPWRASLPLRSWGYFCRCTVDVSSLIGPLEADEAAAGGFGVCRGGVVACEAWGSQRRKSEHRAALQCLCLLLLLAPDAVQAATSEASVPIKLAPAEQS